MFIIILISSACKVSYWQWLDCDIDLEIQFSYIGDPTWSSRHFLRKSVVVYKIIAIVIIRSSFLFQGHRPQDGNSTMTSGLKMESKGTQIHLPLIGRGSRGELNDKVTFSSKSPPQAEQLNNVQVLG